MTESKPKKRSSSNSSRGRPGKKRKVEVTQYDKKFVKFWVWHFHCKDILVCGKTQIMAMICNFFAENLKANILAEKGTFSDTRAKE